MRIQSCECFSPSARSAYVITIISVIGATFEILAGNESDARRKRDGFSFPLAEHRGFSIPQIDLNNRTDLQTVISRDPKIYMGHPSSVLLDDGRTMVMMFLDEHGRGRLMWTRSEDGGRSWSQRLPIPDGWGEALIINGRKHPPFLEIPILYKIDGPDGKQRICAYTGGRNSYPARYGFSEDGGRTWSKLKPLLFGGKQEFGAACLFSDVLRLKNGEYLCTWHRPGTLFTATTRDGITFSQARATVRHPEALPCEGCLIRSPDGGTIALLIREHKRNYNSLICFSEDEGRTWSEPRQMPDSLTGDRHQHTVTPDGRLFISFRDRGIKTPSYGDWVGWIGKFEDLIKGREGQYRVRMKANFNDCDTGYPTQHLLPDGTIFASTYGQWERGKPEYIIGYHFRMEQLDELYRGAKP